ncbi:MAG: trypsin-like serine protease [Lapillicoccus sp.]
MMSLHQRISRVRTVAVVVGALAVTGLGVTATASAAPAASTSVKAVGVTTDAALSPDALVSASGSVVTPQQGAASLAAHQGKGVQGSSPSLGAAGSTGAAPESIIGTDNRFRVNPTTSFPYRATVLILRNGNLHCTGWMISKDTLLTAGHCVHTGGSGGSWYSGLTFKPGSNGGTAPYGTLTSRGTWSLNGWVNSGSTEYDAAIIKLSRPVGNTVGWYGMWWQSAALDGLFSRVTGYPGDKPKQQWMSYDSVRASGTNNIYYQNDTVGGMSGSPVWQMRSSTAAFCAGGPCAMAIHTNGLYGTGLTASNNSGTRITEAKFNTFISIVNLP